MLFSVHENPDPQCSDIRDHDRHLDLSSSSSFSSSTFSIRDYVFGARRKKDIKTSWPFSLKNLKLCLKHGVKDVLPPFQSVDAIRKITSANDDDEKVEHPVLKLDEKVEHPVLKLDEKVARSRETSTSNNNNTLFPSTKTTSVSQHHRQARGPGGSSKSKCKVNSSPEDIASAAQLSEAMVAAAKICPVCKTFSSSSNTTLNAHIDQCLSAESSAPKWTLDSSKLGTRHRVKVKPKKTRLMVDIYVTAFPCTLEDLDRRNGSNWASGGPNSNFSSPNAEECDDKCDKDEKEKDDNADVDDVGAVYIDSNGIKVRILSKPDDEPRVISKLEEDHLRPRKPFKGISARKKKSKLSHYLQLAQTKKLRARSSQVCEGSFDLQKLDNKTGNSETLRPWARSKRSGLAKKLDNNPKSLAETLRDLSASSPENNPNSGPENVFYEAEKDETRSSLLVERSLTPMKRQLRKERTPRMLRSASFATHPVGTCDSQLYTSAELHRSKSMRVSSSVRKYISCAVTEPKSDACLRRDDEERALPWDGSFGKSLPRVEIITGRTPFHHHSHSRRDNYHSRFPTKLAVDHLVDSEMPSFVENGQEQEMFYGVRLGNAMMEEDLNESFPDVDPIPIPGPPGSFLPSPRDMSSEDFQGNNSSLTTSRVHSSQDQRDGDSSDSPVSTAGRYDDDLPPPASSEARNSGIMLFKMGVGFQADGEPCCCQRKDRMNSQESQLLKRRAIMGSANLLDNLNTVETSSERSVVASGRIDSTISPSNPVLRLMGKNLMVGNRDDQDEPAPPFTRQQHVDQRSSAAPFYGRPSEPVVPAGNLWAPSSHQTGQPYSHLYKCQNNGLL